MDARLLRGVWQASIIREAYGQRPRPPNRATSRACLSGQQWMQRAHAAPADACSGPADRGLSGTSGAGATIGRCGRMSRRDDVAAQDRPKEEPIYADPYTRITWLQEEI